VTPTTAYLGALYEKNVTTGVMTTYYCAGNQRVATPAPHLQCAAGAGVRQAGAAYYLHGDHPSLRSGQAFV